MARKKTGVEETESGGDAVSPSRSQKKRESTALQGLGEALARLPATRLGRLPLPPDLREALELMARIADREGRRRQLQYIGRLMRQCDAEAIGAALERLREGPAREDAAFRHTERLRAALLNADGAETDRLLAPWPHAADELRRLAARARGESAPHAARDLFRRLRKLLEDGHDHA